MSQQQGTQQQISRPTWHRTLYAFHEAGHAVVGHVLGRCIAEVSIAPSRGKGYQGYCAFDEVAELWHNVVQWQAGNLTQEQIAVLYAGTIAMKILCERRGWKYEHWRGYDQADLAQIAWRTQAFLPADAVVYQAFERACRNQARTILKHHWRAVEALAAVLVTQGRIRGWEAHRVIQQAIDTSVTDWRMEVGSSRELPSEYLDQVRKSLR